MKISKKTYLVNEEDIETIDYNDPEEDLFEGESIVKAANKVLDYEGFKRNQEKLLKNSSKKSNKSAQITAEKILQKYKILKKPKKTFLVDEKDLETIVYKKTCLLEREFSQLQIKYLILKSLKNSKRKQLAIITKIY